MDQSLDDVIKGNRISNRIKRHSSGGGGGGVGNSKESTSTVDPLQSSLGDIINVKKKHVAKNKFTESKHKRNNDIGMLITVENRNHRHHGHHHHQQHRFREDGPIPLNPNGLFISMPNHNYQDNSNINLFSRGGGGGGSGHHHHQQHRLSPMQKSKQILNKKMRELSANIDHSLFDPRGIRDYSQVKKPNTVSMNGGNGIRNGGRRGGKRDDDYYEEGATLRVKNVAPSVTLRDIGRVFSVIGPVRDYDILFHLTPPEATVVFHKREHAIMALERFNGVPLDGQELIITLEGEENIIQEEEGEDVTVVEEEGEEDIQEEAMNDDDKET